MFTKRGDPFKPIQIGASAAVWFVAGATFAASALAQSASSTLSSYRTGYGGAALSGLESPVSPSLISSGSQFAISDGVNQAGSVGSVFPTSTLASGTSSSATSSGANPSYAGGGQFAASNERAPVAVIDAAAGSRQPTSARFPQTGLQTGGSADGAATSELVLNGKINLDGNP
jgi:hypothetical protein